MYWSRWKTDFAHVFFFFWFFNLPFLARRFIFLLVDLFDFTYVFQICNLFFVVIFLPFIAIKRISEGGRHLRINISWALVTFLIWNTKSLQINLGFTTWWNLFHLVVLLFHPNDKGLEFIDKCLKCDALSMSVSSSMYFHPVEVPVNEFYFIQVS